jgi:hypothetical protein
VRVWNGSKLQRMGIMWNCVWQELCKDCKISIDPRKENLCYTSNPKTHNKLLWCFEVFCVYPLLGISAVCPSQPNHFLFSYVTRYLFACRTPCHVRKSSNIQRHFHQLYSAPPQYTHTTLSLSFLLKLLYSHLCLGLQSVELSSEFWTFVKLIKSKYFAYL